MKKLLVLLGFLAFFVGSVVRSQDEAGHAGGAKHVVVRPDAIEWGPAPPALPPGSHLAILVGDPSQPGVPYVLRAKLPDGYKIPPTGIRPMRMSRSCKVRSWSARARDSIRPRWRNCRPVPSCACPRPCAITPCPREKRSSRFTASGRLTSTMSTPPTIRARKSARIELTSRRTSRAGGRGSGATASGFGTRAVGGLGTG